MLYDSEVFIFGEFTRLVGLINGIQLYSLKPVIKAAPIICHFGPNRLPATVNIRSSDVKLNLHNAYAPTVLLPLFPRFACTL